MLFGDPHRLGPNLHAASGPNLHVGKPYPLQANSSLSRLVSSQLVTLDTVGFFAKGHLPNFTRCALEPTFNQQQRRQHVQLVPFGKLTRPMKFAAGADVAIYARKFTKGKRPA